MRARRARAGDAAAIHQIVAHYAAQGMMLPRSEREIHEHVARFLVLEDKGAIAGCVALEPYGTDLAEIRSLAVSPEILGRGLGARLLQAALTEARRKKVARVFAVTHAAEFFTKQGFATSSRHALPEKIERDCRTCSKARTCRLIAVVFTACPERVALPVLETAVAPSPAV